MGKLITVIDYGMGNLFSVAKALEALGSGIVVSSKPEDLRIGERIVLPGVGAFGDGMEKLRKLGLVEELREQVLEKGKPFLGICLGMQLLARTSTENGLHEGLGWIPASVKRLDSIDGKLKIPHMGWNEVLPREGSVLFSGLGEKPTFYFVHSYHVVCDKDGLIAAICEYGQEFTASIHHRNIFGVQFHPEKSQRNGFQVLRNFINYDSLSNWNQSAKNPRHTDSAV